MKEKKHGDCAAIWFAILERAINLGDVQREAEARKKLKEFGFEVSSPVNSGRSAK